MSARYHILLLAVGCTMMFSCCGEPKHEQVVAWYEQGKALREQGEPAEAMTVFLQAAHSGTDDKALLGRICSNMANICRQANEHGLAYEVYASSAEHFAAAGDTLAYAYALNNMAWEQAVMGHKDSALALVAAAVENYPHPPLTEKVIESRAAACLFAEEYDSVLLYTVPPANDYLLMLRAQAYSYIGRDDSATCYARALLPRVSNPFYLDDIYYILTHNDAQAGTDDLRELSSERADVQKAIELRHGKLMQAVQILQNDRSVRRTETRTMVVMSMLGALLAAILTVGIITIRERRRLYRDKEQHEHARQEELARTLANLQDAEDIRLELSWGDYQALCIKTDRLFHGLAERLIKDGLNEQDIRICVLVLIGMSHKQIASMLPCSPKSIGKLKDITAHKLGVSGGQLRETLVRQVVDNG